MRDKLLQAMIKIDLTRLDQASQLARFSERFKLF